MTYTIIEIPTRQIGDWESFHQVFKNIMGFPDSYGMIMNSWYECMRELDQDTGMTTINLDIGEVVILKIVDAKDFAKRCPEIFTGLIEATAILNSVRQESGLPENVALMMVE